MVKIKGKTICYITPLFFVLFLMCMPDTIFASDTTKNYTRLMEWIHMEDRDGPFFAFNDFEQSFDRDLHKANMEFFNSHPELIKKIQSNLNNLPIRWHIENISHRLLYVPEKRKEYAELFESYCNDVIGDVLELTKLKNPYIKIHTLGDDKPENSEANGINVFIVHNLVKEYVTTYVFSSDAQKQISVELTDKVFSGEVGSYSSYVHLNENGSFEFIRDSYTIWQNSAKNPYTALMTPVEETLHIALRQYTEKAIKDEIENSAAKTLKEVEPIVEDWISVEEAIVGGLVYVLLPSIIEKHIQNLPESFVQSDIETKSDFKKYRHLRKGIKIVEQLGYKKSIKIYRDDPMTFRNLLI